MIEVGPLAVADRAAWEVLARGYKAFYRTPTTDAEYAAAYYWMTQDHNATARALYDKLATHHGFIRYDYPVPG